MSTNTTQAVTDVGEDEREIVRARMHPGRWVVSIVVLLIVVVAAQSVARNPRVQWDVIGDYLFDPRILAGVRTTLVLTLLCVVFGTVIATAIAICRISDNRVLSSLAAAYVWWFRSTPVLVQLFLWYNIGFLYPRLHVSLPFGGATLLDVDANTVVTPQVAAGAGLTLYFVAYMVEIIRGGIGSVNFGQNEAGLAVGMTPLRCMLTVILPQALRSILPATGNEIISLIKYTSLVSVLGISDLLYSAQQIYETNYLIIPLLIVAAIWYFAIVSTLSVGQHFLERHYGRGHVRTS